MPETFSEPLKPKQSRIITKVLSPALRLWLRSQTSQVSALDVEILGSDRQILSGYIPKVIITADGAVYQGLHLTQIHLVAENIRINIGAVVKGKPLRLLEPVPVVGELLLLSSDLNASLSSTLLSTALTDVLGMLLLADFALFTPINWQKITINNGSLNLDATLTPQANSTPIQIKCGINLANPQQLKLAPIQIQTQTGSPLPHKQSFCQDLGSEVDIQELSLSDGQICCRGRVNVLP